MDYQTCIPSLIMDFVFMKVGGNDGWRIYIISDINYKGRQTDGHSTHRLHFDGDTYMCICWRGKIKTLREAKAIAALWADTTAIYIASGVNGKSFDAIAAQI